jgi:hypothetical protein
VNGDGRADIVATAFQTSVILLNQSGVGIDAPKLVETTVDVDARGVTFVFSEAIDPATLERATSRSPGDPTA